MRKILISFIILLVIGFSSCTDTWLDVNKNVDAPDWVNPILRLGPVLASYEGIQFDLRAAAPLSQYFSGTSTYVSNFGVSHSYIAGSDAAGESWRMTYWLQGMNVENIINDSRDLGQFRLAGIGLTVKAYSWHILASLHGDIPVKDAYVPGLLSHNYDSQEYAFSKVRSWARQAIAEFEKADATIYPASLSTADLIYKGDAAKWKKFAYAVLARNYIAMSKKNVAYLDSAVICADLSFASASDDPSLTFQATGVSSTSNFFGVLRGNLTNVFAQSDYITQVMTGTIPNYSASGAIEGLSPYQMVTDTATLDPRAILLLGTLDTMQVDQAKIKKGTYKFVGTRLTNAAACTFWGLTTAPTVATSGTGRWLYRDDAPWPLSSYAEIQFVKAEALYLKGQKAEAFVAFKNGVAGHMEFVKRLIVPGILVKNAKNKQTSVIGDKITAARFSQLATEYLNSKFVNGMQLADFTLSNIMMQKYVALFPWSLDTWNDLRRYHYDLVLGSGGVPVSGTSWTNDVAYHKLDSDPARVYKGFFLPSADVVNRRTKFATANLGSPAYRLRPRYNSEYMWNLPSLQKLLPIPGDKDNYNTSQVWFTIPAGK
ncbi:MAG: SusD/RagB family nutrient-binding outer membrane lipoprotein [Bacteroidota bacterium]|nr:SusD/RagB family nutrient-binding outer membrane lipoprotein [Odoribacter sp.]MDP3644157.1 SusD/RagB family nutrient-binding outer membrane lipoprotein [Bacteroidota bacterium]